MNIDGAAQMSHIHLYGPTMSGKTTLLLALSRASGGHTIYHVKNIACSGYLVAVAKSTGIVFIDDIQSEEDVRVVISGREQLLRLRSDSLVYSAGEVPVDGATNIRLQYVAAQQISSKPTGE